MLRVLGVLAAIALVASELPLMIAAPVACASVLYGDWLARCESRRKVAEVVIPAHEALPSIDGSPMDDLQVQWRGPLVFLRWHDERGRRRYLQGWPDNLAPDERRELRLAMTARAPAHSPRSVAP